MTKLAQPYGIYSIFDFSCKLSILPSVCTDKQGSNIAAWFEGKILGHHKRAPVILAAPNMCLRGTTMTASTTTSTSTTTAQAEASAAAAAIACQTCPT